MTIADAAQFGIALIALGVAIYAVQRDRAVLRVRLVDGAAGTWILSVVNVGLRPVRVEKVVRQVGWMRRRADDMSSWMGEAERTPFPVIVEPADEIRVVVANEKNLGGRGRWYVVDAAGRRYRIQ